MGVFKEKVDKYFKAETKPFSKKQVFNLRNIGISVGVVFLVIITVSSLWDQQEREVRDEQTKELSRASGKAVQAPTTGNRSEELFINPSEGYRPSFVASKAPRVYAKSQIVKSGSGSFFGFLPQGTTVHARLVNKVNSTDTDSPVIAVVTKPIIKDGETLIATGTRIIGRGRLNQYSGRLCVEFSTFVLPEGTEKPISGLAVMPDGSSCITGNYNSGSVKKHTVEFFGDFIGGLAEGMKRREANDRGIPFESGGLENGLLNGLSRSASNLASSSSREYGQARPKVNVEAGVSFLLFLNRRYEP